MTGQTEDRYSIRQAAYDLRKLRGKHLVDKPARSQRYVVPESAARIIAGLSVLRDQVIVPILAGLRRDTRADQQTSVPDRIDGHYAALRTGMQALLLDLGITAEDHMAA